MNTLSPFSMVNEEQRRVECIACAIEVCDTLNIGARKEDAAFACATFEHDNEGWTVW